MVIQSSSRRGFLQSSLTFGAAALLLNRTRRAQGFISANERPHIGAIGTGSRWCQGATGLKASSGSAPDVAKYGDYVAVCDADAHRRELAAGLVKQWTGNTPASSADYRAII